MATVRQLLSLVGGIAISMVLAKSWKGNRNSPLVSGIFAKAPAGTICVRIVCTTPVAGAISTTGGGWQAVITSSASGRQYLLYEDNLCTNPLYFN